MKSSLVKFALLGVCVIVAAGLGVRERMAGLQTPLPIAASHSPYRADAHPRTVAVHRETPPHAHASASHGASAASGAIGASAGKSTPTPRERLVALRAPLSLESANNPFAASSWLPPPPPPVEVPTAPPESAAPPTAPPVPFTFLGEQNAKTATPKVFLSSGDQLLIVSPGEVINGQYRVDSISDTDVLLTYLPLNVKQVISMQSEGK
ncbi:hypothetical protein [Pararobbsia alpina]|uniref:Secretion system X translation initiation factor n=1 Tax=Pararobbsia alpina TaxID=621374 RepID=A0A6S7CWU6_9BURK|nr:hypothetical protein [Pararobbsia alpina]CAB3789986.1 hypothetical protein LMG28138_02888 [Pararobbsia alpina]